MVKRKDIIAKARSWIGIEYRFRGRSRQGIDCSGLVVGVAKELKLFDYDFTNYVLNDPHVIEQHILKSGMFEVPVHDRLPGDVLNIAIKNNPIHLAILANDVRMIHTNQSVNMVVECSIPHKRDRILRVFRYPNVED